MRILDDFLARNWLFFIVWLVGLIFVFSNENGQISSVIMLFSGKFVLDFSGLQKVVLLKNLSLLPFKI
jgi:hypothetical protein